MIEIIPPGSRRARATSLDDMHRLRYRVAVEQWGWKIPGVTAGYDKDQFDTDQTIYILAYAGAGERLVGAARLNPTTGPHMLSELFGDFCELQPAPRDPAVYEFSRYVIDHAALSKDEQFRIRGRLSAAINDFCLRTGVRALSWFSYRSMYQRAVQMWETAPLGLPRHFPDDDQTYIAAVSQMTAEGLARLRMAFSLSPGEPALGIRESWENIDRRWLDAEPRRAA